QVNQAITQMDEGTQQNAALVEEATAAARSMEQQAGQLVQTVAVFRVQEDEPVHHARTTTQSASASAGVATMPARRPTASHATPAPRVAARRVAAMAVETAGDWQEF